MGPGGWQSAFFPGRAEPPRINLLFCLDGSAWPGPGEGAPEMELWLEAMEVE